MNRTFLRTSFVKFSCFFYNLIAGTKNSLTSKVLKESKADLTFLLKTQALHLTKCIYPVCNYLVVTDHTFMTTCLNLADFTDFFLLETLILLIERCVAQARKLSCGQPDPLRDTKCNAFVLPVV